MSDTNALIALATANGAVFSQSPTGTWIARRSDTAGIWGMSQVDAAARFLEEIGVEPTEPAAILAAIKHQFRPYDQMPEFRVGFDSHQSSRFHQNPYGDGVAAQAWDRGYTAAMLYDRALAHLDAPQKPVPASPGWLQRLLRGGRA